MCINLLRLIGHFNRNSITLTYATKFQNPHSSHKSTQTIRKMSNRRESAKRPEPYQRAEQRDDQQEEAIHKNNYN